MNRVQQRLPRFMSLIFIAQGETFHISFAQFVNKGYGVDPHDTRIIIGRKGENKYGISGL